MKTNFTRNSSIHLSPAGLAWTSLLAAAVVFLAGCAKNPADGTTAAEVKSPGGAAASKSAPVAGAKIYTLAEDSAIGFVGSKVTGSHTGGFKKFNGQFAVANGAISAPGSQISIDIDSLWADNDRLTGHLKSPDFFDAAAFPQATFELTSSEKADGSKVKLTGNLNLHGVTKQISFPAELNVQGKQATLKAEFHIKRFDFAIKFAGKADDLIRDEVVIKLDVKGVAKG